MILNTLLDRAATRVQYLRYFHDLVFYLPFPSPEQAIWNDDVAHHMLTTILDSTDAALSEMRNIRAAPDHKRKFALLSAALGHGDDLHPQPVHTMFLTRFVIAGGRNLEAVRTLLDQVVAAAGAAHA